MICWSPRWHAPLLSWTAEGDGGNGWFPWGLPGPVVITWRLVGSWKSWKLDTWKETSFLFVDSRNCFTCTYPCLLGSRKRLASKLYCAGCLTLKIVSVALTCLRTFCVGRWVLPNSPPNFGRNLETPELNSYRVDFLFQDGHGLSFQKRLAFFNGVRCKLVVIHAEDHIDEGST